MKKGLIVGIILVALVVIVVAGFVWTPTGNVIEKDIASAELGGYLCEDTDGGSFENVKGTTKRMRLSDGKVMLQREDTCSGAFHVEEGFCKYTARMDSEKKYCKNGCLDGACVLE